MLDIGRWMLDVSRFLLTAILSLLLLSAFHLPAKDLTDYQIGDKAEEDILATAKLTVIDPDATEAMKQKEAQRVPVVIRYDTNAANELESRFRDVFAKTQDNFLKSVNKSFGHRALSGDELESSKFYSLTAAFAKQNKLFPLDTNRATIWASGDPDSAYETSLADLLRQAVAPVIRPEPLPDGIKLGGTVRIVAVGDAQSALALQSVEKNGKNMSRTNLVPLPELKKNFQAIFGPEERAVAKYLTTLLQPNCTVDEDATQQLRAKRADGIWAVVTYEPGEVVAHRGQVIDKKIKAALDQLKDKAVVGQLHELQVKQQAAVDQLHELVAEDNLKAAQSQEHIRWLIAALAGVVVILALAIWQLARRRQTVSLLPVPVSGDVEQWQQRALIAEQRSENLRSAARAGLFAHLSQWLSRALTQRLLSQRQLLLDTQSTAAAEMAELEARLAKVQAPLQVRLQAYEYRIAELEKELDARNAENRELLKAKIEVLRKQLEAQREKNRLEFN